MLFETEVASHGFDEKQLETTVIVYVVYSMPRRRIFQAGYAV